MNIAKSLLPGLMLSLVLAGCKESEPDYTTVAVYPSQQRCGINEQMMICGDVGTYLRDTLKLKPERQVIVSAVGVDPLPKDDRSLEIIADKVREAGSRMCGPRISM
ncbi:MAG: hypothetical protein QM808_15100 [Steroidobacteraceae bacterium]